MARAIPIPIRERRRGSVAVPVEVVPTKRPFRLPLVISFRFRGRRIPCALVWNDAGDPVSLTYDCPKCRQAVVMLDPVLFHPHGGLTTFLRCLTAGCGLRLKIENGVTNELPPLWPF